VNLRSDGYGGSADGRNRLVLEVAQACVDAIGAHKVGIRVSPHGVFNGTGAYQGVEAQYAALVEKLSNMGLVYLHQLDHSAMGAPAVPAALKLQLRRLFKQTYIAAGGFDADSAESLLASGNADLVAFGRPFLCNPDLVARMQAGAALNAPDMSTFYTPGEKGYTDYAVLA
jgi:N-ethylmaleimide reductase